MIIASATNDKDTIIKDHFGDAKFFAIYEVLEDSICFIDVIDNTSRLEEGSHTEKANNIIKLLKQNNVDILVNRAFGSNLKIIDKYLLPIIIRKTFIKDSLFLIQENILEIKKVSSFDKQVYMTISADNLVKIMHTK